MTVAGVEPIDFHGLPALRIIAPDGACALVTEHGAHVVSWVPADGGERLYLSPRSAFAAGKAIRGGIPVIFPQFSSEGPLPRHGFARTARLSPVATGVVGGASFARLRLFDDAGTRATWPPAFVAEIEVRVAGAQLAVSLAVENPGAAPFGFTAALHTYLRVADVAVARLAGLSGVRLRDNADDRRTRRDEDQAVAVAGEIDRVYFDVPRRLTLAEPGRTLEIVADGFPDAVVWNPGPEKCAQLADMPPQGWREMLCVEAALIGRPATVAPGARWQGTQTLLALQ